MVRVEKQTQKRMKTLSRVRLPDEATILSPAPVGTNQERKESLQAGRWRVQMPRGKRRDTDSETQAERGLHHIPRTVDSVLRRKGDH